ncbi:MAG TPA: hypothetical protein VE693_00340 [Gaiellaceae bacterium]|jgi:capsular polysaccharide biosynthesis protein|nr:hypothetical protein [Gaiellaceae bacterium]
MTIMRGAVRLSSFARRWWLLVIPPLIGALLAYAYGSRIASVYEAKATLVASAPAGAEGLNSVAAQVPTYGELVDAIPVLRAALDTLKLPVAPEELQPNVRGEADASTRTLTIRVRDRNPRVAAAIANALTHALDRSVAAAAPPTRPGSHANAIVPRFTVLQPAVGAARIRPRILLTTGFGALSGLFSGIAIVVLALTAGRTVRGEDELARLAPIPVFGSVNGARVRAADALLGGVGNEAYGRLAARILSSTGGRPPRNVLVIGAHGNEGSPAVASKLALAFARIGSVFLTDLESEHPIAKLFGIGETSAGAFAKRSSPLRHGSLTVDRFALRGALPLSVALLRGRDALSPEAEDARAVLVQLLAQADFVVLHARSLGSSPAALVWARMSDAVLVVVRPRRSRRQSVASTIDALSLTRTRVAGTVLTRGEP